MQHIAQSGRSHPEVKVWSAPFKSAGKLSLSTLSNGKFLGSLFLLPPFVIFFVIRKKPGVVIEKPPKEESLGADGFNHAMQRVPTHATSSGRNHLADEDDCAVIAFVVISVIWPSCCQWEEGKCMKDSFPAHSLRNHLAEDQ